MSTELSEIPYEPPSRRAGREGVWAPLLRKYSIQAPEENDEQDSRQDNLGACHHAGLKLEYHCPLRDVRSAMKRWQEKMEV